MLPKAKKSLGQNFFINESLGDKIVSLISCSEKDTLLEIGPGRGFFTEKLLQKCYKIIAVEKDDTLAEFLQTKLSLHNRIKIVNEDILLLSKKRLLSDVNIVFGSLPYNIAKKIITFVFRKFENVESFYAILQREVAQKYIEETSLLHRLTMLYAKPTLLISKISAGSFRPVPRVDSAFIRFDTRERFCIEEKDIKEFEIFLKSLYKFQRKKLKNSLPNVVLQNVSSQLLNKRVEDLSLQELYDIFKR